jgi:hypothetical protein
MMENISSPKQITMTVMGLLKANLTKNMVYNFKVCTSELKEFVTRE